MKREGLFLLFSCFEALSKMALSLSGSEKIRMVPSCVCLRAVSAVVVHKVCQTDTIVNSVSVAEQRALSRLTDQEHEASTCCSLDIVSVIPQSLLLSCEHYHIWHLWEFNSEKPNYKICSRCGCCHVTLPLGLASILATKVNTLCSWKSSAFLITKSASNRICFNVVSFSGNVKEKTTNTLEKYFSLYLLDR